MARQPLSKEDSEALKEFYRIANEKSVSGGLSPAEIIFSFIITWVVGLSVPLLIRFVFLRRAMSKGAALITVALCWCANIVIFTALGSQNKTHAVLFLIAWISYHILRKGHTSTEVVESRTTQENTIKDESIKAPILDNQSLDSQEEQNFSDKKGLAKYCKGCQARLPLGAEKCFYCDGELEEFNRNLSIPLRGKKCCAQCGVEVPAEKHICGWCACEKFIDAINYRTLAQTLYDSNKDLGKGLRYASMAIEMQPDNKTAYEIKARILYKLARYSELAEFLLKAKELVGSSEVMDHVEREAFGKWYEKSAYNTFWNWIGYICYFLLFIHYVWPWIRSHFFNK